MDPRERYNLDWANCGTEANHRAHLRRKETPCRACISAATEANRVRREKRRAEGRRVQTPFVGEHGTHLGAKKHYSRGEKPCEPCRLAENAFQQDRRMARVGR